jgi:hypothetical protein
MVFGEVTDQIPGLPVIPHQPGPDSYRHDCPVRFRDEEPDGSRLFWQGVLVLTNFKTVDAITRKNLSSCSTETMRYQISFDRHFRSK